MQGECFGVSSWINVVVMTSISRILLGIENYYCFGHAAMRIL